MYSECGTSEYHIMFINTDSWGLMLSAMYLSIVCRDYHKVSSKNCQYELWVPPIIFGPLFKIIYFSKHKSSPTNLPDNSPNFLVMFRTDKYVDLSTTLYIRVQN